MQQATVIIPTYNRIDTIDKTIKSVSAQSLEPADIIIVDDCSSDGLVEYVGKKYPHITVLQNETNRGAAFSRNHGAESAKTEYIAFLDSDDFWHPDHLKKAIQHLQNKNVDGVYGQFFLYHGSKVMRTNLKRNEKMTLLENIFSLQRFDARTSTFVFKREAFQKVRFDPDLKKYQDWDLAARFDRDFQFSLNPHSTVDLIVGGQERMSDNFNKSAFLYFYEKHKKDVRDDYVFMFLIKSLHRTKDKEVHTLIFKEFEKLDLNYRNAFFYYLLKKKLVSTGFLRIMKNMSTLIDG